MASSSSQTVLDTNDYNDVLPACKSVRAHWRDLGTRLGVLVHTLDSIETDYNGKVERCMPAMIEKWLQRPLGEVCDGVIPTWRSLCVALSHIDRALADRLAEEHNCGDISMSADSVCEEEEITSDGKTSMKKTGKKKRQEGSGSGNSRPQKRKVSKMSPSVDASLAFLPQSCGCGKCTIQGWRTGRMCQNVLEREYIPKLLIVNPEHPVATNFVKFERSYDRQARLCAKTSDLVSLFTDISLETWTHLDTVVNNQTSSISDMAFKLGIWLNKPLPMISRLHELQSHLHSLRVSWFNFGALFFLVKQFLSSCPDLLATWNNYIAIFKQYCSTRSLKDYVDVFFHVEEHNVFLLEVDEHYYDFTLSDIKGLCDSLSLALKCPSVCLHLVTIKKACLIIYLYYCFTDYLTVFQSLTKEQLKEISHYRILSLTDLHNQFRYKNIQSYAEAPSNALTSAADKGKEGEAVDTSIESICEEERKDKLYQEIEMLKKQSFYKDVELTSTKNELLVARDDTKRKEEEVNELRRQLGFRDVDVSRAKEVEMLKKQYFYKDVELTRTRNELVVAQDGTKKKEEEVNELKRQLGFRDVDVSRAKAGLKEETPRKKELNDSLLAEIQEVKRQSLSKESEFSKKEVELADSIKKWKEEIEALKKQLELRDAEFSKTEAELVDKIKDLEAKLRGDGKRKVFGVQQVISTSKPTIQKLDEHLRGLVHWERFALYLPEVDQTDINIIKKSKRNDIVEEKLTLYKTWLDVYPNASWDNVIQALEKVKENTIASNLRATFPTARAEIMSSKQPEKPEAMGEVQVNEDVVEELTKLHTTFLSLTKDVKSGIESGVEQGNMTTKSLVRHTEELRAFPIKALQSVKTTDDFFQAIMPHYNFLDCYLIVSLAMLLSGSIATRANEYSEQVRMFMRTTTVKCLQRNLKHYYQIAKTRNIFVSITVENAWDMQSMWFVKTLVQRLFPIKHPDENQWFDVVPG